MTFLSTLRLAFKSGGGAVRPPLTRLFPAPWNIGYQGASFAEDAPFSYEASVRAGYGGNPVAQRAVRIVAEGVGGAPLCASDPTLATLVGATSAGQGLIETAAAQLLLHGNAYVQILRGSDGRPCELYALRPDRVTIVPDARGWPAAFTYRAGEATVHIDATGPDGLPQIVHVKGFAPLDDHYGLGCLGAAARAVAVHNAASAWNRALLDNAARPSGALV